MYKTDTLKKTKIGFRENFRIYGIQTQHGETQNKRCTNVLQIWHALF